MAMGFRDAERPRTVSLLGYLHEQWVLSEALNATTAAEKEGIRRFVDFCQHALPEMKPVAFGPCPEAPEVLGVRLQDDTTLALFPVDTPLEAGDQSFHITEPPKDRRKAQPGTEMPITQIIKDEHVH